MTKEQLRSLSAEQLIERICCLQDVILIDLNSMIVSVLYVILILFVSGVYLLW